MKETTSHHKGRNLPIDTNTSDDINQTSHQSNTTIQKSKEPQIQVLWSRPPPHQNNQQCIEIYCTPEVPDIIQRKIQFSLSQIILIQ
jgi:hypothetical protein